MQSYARKYVNSLLNIARMSVWLLRVIEQIREYVHVQL